MKDRGDWQKVGPRPAAKAGSTSPPTMLARLHRNQIFPRRKRVLAAALAQIIPPHSRVLDVGSGDGSIAARIQKLGTGLTIEGIDVLVRDDTAIPVQSYDGVQIPYDDDSMDVVLFVDVLHHTPDPQILLHEAARVAKRCVIIKDHHRDGLLAGPILRLMDWVGNAHHGVALPYNYWSRQEWARGYARAGLLPVTVQTRLGLYPFWADWLFGRRLHSIVKLEKQPG
jgi:SAM-dependent methyltransferase